MKDEYMLCLRQDAKEVLDCLLFNRKQFISKAKDLKKLNDKLDINTRKYSLENVMTNIYKALDSYVDECDYTSFGSKDNKEKGIRQYLVTPYIDQALYDVIFDVIDDIKERYSLDDVSLVISDKNSPKAVKEKEAKRSKMEKLIENISDILYSYNFTFDLNDSISYYPSVELLTESFHKTPK
ncbi:MAG: hypothetical protein QXL94_06040 [Candidatus Parvarchaeum sp.]